jgi:outer membrane immunogenic protein
MRKLFQATAGLSLLMTTLMAANAADVVRPYPPPPPAPLYAPPAVYAPTWMGFYLGGNIGGAWVHRDVTDSLFGLTFGDGNNNGVFVGGGQLGFNAQFSSLVLGVEWDFDWAGNNNNTGNGVVIPGSGNFVLTSNNRWITTLAARFGWAYGPWLFYGKAGGGWAGNNDFTLTNVTTGASITGFNDNNNSTGWLLGAGIEWAFVRSWSAKIEYEYLGLNSRTFIVPAGFPALAGDTFTTGNRNIQMVKVGINYLFSWGPVAARY